MKTDYEKTLYNHYKELLVGAKDWAIEQAYEEDMKRQRETADYALKENDNLKKLLKTYVEISDGFLDGNGHLNSLEMHTVKVKRILK